VTCDVSIIIPVLDRLEFTRQCLDRIWRNTADDIAYEVIVIDNGSTDGTDAWFEPADRFPRPLRYLRNSTNEGFARANNRGAGVGRGQFLLFLNNDTLVEPGWLTEMLRVRRADPAVGVVGIQQRFPYTNTIYHTGIVFSAEGLPEHLYPHLDASVPEVNKQREYQAVTGACLLTDKELFESCGGFDEEYQNGYEDVDLCLKVRQRNRKVVCCTSAFIYHYGQISEARTAADDRNAALFARKWSGIVRPDRHQYVLRDRLAAWGRRRSAVSPTRILPDDAIYLADALDDGSALTWINAELALALAGRGVPVFVNGQAPVSRTLSASMRRRLSRLKTTLRPVVGGTQVKWSHYRPRHLTLELSGLVNLEFFVINYVFGSSTVEPWDFWLQCLRQNHHHKLPLSEFCRSVLQQVGVTDAHSHVWYPGYSPEIADAEPSRRPDARFRFFTVTNSHDLDRYNTAAVLGAYRRAFSADDEVVLIVKDYGASSGNPAIRDALGRSSSGPKIEYISEFTDKRALIGLYQSSDAFVSAHRGEGFGMKILDAMACGVPVIAPLFGGVTAYCREDNCFPVAFSLLSMGACLDTASLHITNQPMWAEVDVESLRNQMRRVYEDRHQAKSRAERGRNDVIGRFSWDSAAARLLEITTGLRTQTESSRSVRDTMRTDVGLSSPYWLGLRVSVVIPTRNRRSKLIACLDALGRQSVLPQEFEVIIVDDGSTDDTRQAIDGYAPAFAVRYFRQESAGPGTARNLGIAQARGELVLFVGDDIIADEHLIEQHLLAHAAANGSGAAVLGHIDWAPSLTPNAVMEYVCGDAMLQFAYGIIPSLPALDHRFFYTSNISLKRQFLLDAADAGVRFDPCFRRAAFEDSEFAFRLAPRGLRIHYRAAARAFHDHWMDVESFSRREFSAGEMAVVFYRKHPGEDEQLQVGWIADLVRPAAALSGDAELLRELEYFDASTDVWLPTVADSLEKQPSAPELGGGALHGVLGTIFDVERTRGKIQEWYSNVDVESKIRAAQTLAAALRKVEWLSGNDDALRQMSHSGSPVDPRAVATLAARVAGLDGMSALTRSRSPSQALGQYPGRRPVSRLLVPRLQRVDRYVQALLQSRGREDWLAKYRRLRRRIGKLM